MKHLSGSFMEHSVSKKGMRRGKSSINSVFLIFLSLILVSFVALVPINAFAENISGVEYDEVSVDFTGQNEGYSAVLYNNSNGHPTSEANAIAETEEGFIWIGSYSGLIRYDGNTFERVDSTTGITSVVCLYVDSKNRLWIGTNDNGLAVLDNGEYTVYPNVGNLQSFSIRCITEDLFGNIYIATTHGMGVVDTSGNISQLNETQLNGEYIDELRTDENTGVIYGVTQDGAVFTIENGKLSGYFNDKGLNISHISTILPDPKNAGYVYIGTEESTIYYGNLRDGMRDAEVIDVSPLNCVNSMEYIDSKLWICADNGIGIRDYAGFRQVYNIPMNNSIDQMLADYEGNLWFSSSRQGVLKIVRNQFTDVFAKYNLSEDVVNSTCKYESYLFLATDTGLIAVEGGGKVDHIAIKSIDNAPTEYANCKNFIELLDGIRIRSIVRDSNNVVWLSTFSKLGLVKFDDGHVTIYNSDNGMPSNRIRVAYERKDGTHLVACTGGVVCLGENGIDTIYGENSGLSNIEVLTVTEGYNNEIIAGTDGDGIYVIKDHEIVNLGKDDGLGSQVVMRIKNDPKREIYWIVTSNSIAYMTKDYEIHTINNFPYSNNFDLYENSNGEIWVLASNGVYVVSAEELLKNEEIYPVFYSMDNGLPCVSTANSYSELTEDGSLYISGSTGVAKVNIDNDFHDVTNIKMSVPYVIADGVTYYADENGVINVPSRTKRMTVYGYVFTYSLMNPKVTYYLDGFEKNVHVVDRYDFEPVAYTNIRGNTYHFIMELNEANGVGENILDTTIVVQKAFYETIWFWGIVLLIIGLVAYKIIQAAVAYKTKALLKKQKENKIFIREMIEAFARTIDMKDRYTKGHSTRVAEFTALLTKELGYDEETVEKYYNIALLHDIGKIGIKPEVLNKEGKLTDEEFTIIKSHSIQGYNVLKDISIMPELAIGACSHHERPDGKGYPKGLKGDEIPRVAQIIAVADTFDAMYSDRPYRKRMNFDRVVSIITEVSGTQLSSDVVDAFLRLVEKGEFKDPDDDGGGSVEDINNIHKKYNEQEKKEEEKKSEEKKDSDEKAESKDNKDSEKNDAEKKESEEKSDSKDN